MFPISEIDVPPEARRDEQLGSKPKFWFEQDGVSSLFKAARENEDWSEKVAEQCAEILGIPHAEVVLAACNGVRGTVSKSFLDAGDRLVHGNELLLQRDPTYPIQGHYHVSEHTVETVGHALVSFAVSGHGYGNCALPAGFTGEDEFVGYLMLDAWIANTDRHHQNWAVIHRGAARLLAPSFDHASSLGRAEKSEKVAARLAGADTRYTVEAYVEKARSALYRSVREAKPLGTVAAFEAFGGRRPEAAKWWLGKLADLSDDTARELLAEVPPRLISEPHRTFACAILKANRDRLLALIVANE